MGLAFSFEPSPFMSFPMLRLPPPSLLGLFGGVFGWCCVSSLAQGQVVRSPEVPPAVQIASKQSVTSRNERLREIQVELAWLADPATYPHALIARVVGSEIYVLGTVNDTRAKSRAIQLAGIQTGMQVVDHVQFVPAVRTNSSTKSTYQLQRDAQRLIKDYSPILASRVQVQAWPQGHVTIRGWVATYEEKLQVSRCLRGLPGCIGVVNQMQVTSESAPMGGVVGVIAMQQTVDKAPGTVIQTAAISRPIAVETKAPASNVSVGVIVMEPEKPKSGSIAKPRKRIVEVEQLKPAPVVKQEIPIVKLETPKPLHLPKPAQAAVLPLPSPAPQRTVVRAASTDQIKNRVAMVCNRPPQEVQIEQTSADSLSVRVAAKSVQEGEALSRQIFKLPELAPYSTTLDVVVTP